MTIEVVKMEGFQRARVQYTLPNDPTLGWHITRVEVVGDLVKVGTPLTSYQDLSILEVQSVVQLILGRAVQVEVNAVDQLDDVEINGCVRCWKTFRLVG
jgi:hypothetical protein